VRIEFGIFTTEGCFFFAVIANHRTKPEFTFTKVDQATVLEGRTDPVFRVFFGIWAIQHPYLKWEAVFSLQQY
jgi:hypothetical protein